MRIPGKGQKVIAKITKIETATLYKSNLLIILNSLKQLMGEMKKEHFSNLNWDQSVITGGLKQKKMVNISYCLIVAVLSWRNGIVKDFSLCGRLFNLQTVRWPHFIPNGNAQLSVY